MIIKLKKELKVRKLFSVIAKNLFHDDYCILKCKLIVLNQNLNYVKIAKFENIVELLILGEDHRFYSHFGFDLIGIFRAVNKRLFYNKTEGASIIEQQLVRVLISDYRKTFKRKIKEILLATIISDFIPKNNIPIVYLKVAHFGTNLNGIDSIITKLDPDNRNQISLEVGAEIIARLKYPEKLISEKKLLMRIEKRKMHLLYLYKKSRNGQKN